MKTRFTLLAVIIAAFFSASAQQIPNGGFENWTNAVTPTGWTSIEDVVQSATSIFTYEDTIDYYQGHASLKLVSDSLYLEPSKGVIGAFISLGGVNLGSQLSFNGIPFAFRPDTFFFAYQYTSPGTDTAVAQLLMTQGGLNVVFAYAFPLTPYSNWSPVAIPLDQLYDTAGLLPDTLLIQFSSSNKAPVKGSTLHVDGLRFGYAQAPPPSLTATITPTGGSTVFCTGDSLILNANTGAGFTYQWALDSVPITGATGASYAAKIVGWYNVSVDSSGIHAFSQSVYVTDTVCVTGFNNIAAAQLEVYPNPATNLLNINANVNLGGYSLQVYDIIGRLVIRQALEGSNNNVNVAVLANGTYILRINDKQSNVVSQQKFNILK
jgi:hypothetical protein